MGRSGRCPTTSNTDYGARVMSQGASVALLAAERRQRPLPCTPGDPGVRWRRNANTRARGWRVVRASVARGSRLPAYDGSGTPWRCSRASECRTSAASTAAGDCCGRCASDRAHWRWLGGRSLRQFVVAAAASGLMWANMLRPFQVGKARTSHEGPWSWIRESRVASFHESCPACHFTNASASAVM